MIMLTGCPDEEPDAGPRDASDSGMTPVDSGSEPDAEVDAGEGDSGPADGGFVPPAYDTWVNYEPPGAVCANGSQYKFFVKFSRTSSNVVIFFEGGGACWDYAGCTGTGIRSAANRDGLADSHATALTNIGGISIPAD